MQISKYSTLTEILEEATKSISFEDRVKDFKYFYDNFDFFKRYIDLCFFEENNFKDFENFEFSTKFKPLDKSKLLTYSRDVILNYLPKLSDNSSIKINTKYSLFSSLLEEVAGEDINLLIGMIKGKYEGNPKINKLFLSKVFTEKKLNGV